MEFVKYKTPIAEMKRVVNEEIVAAQIRYGDNWPTMYFNNFHYYFPYIQHGKYHLAYYYERVKKAGRADVPRIERYRQMDMDKELEVDGNSELALTLSPEDRQVLRCLFELELGVTEQNLMPTIKAFYDSYEIPNRDHKRRSRLDMYKLLEPFWVRYRALGLNINDLWR
jgi:hypothetical protein